MCSNVQEETMSFTQAGSRALRRSALGLAIVFWLALAATALAEIQLTLKRSFIEQYKNRATITATFTVDKAHEHPNPANRDGDLHIAGRAPEIGLPTVAEIMNAKSEQEAVDLIHQAEQTGNSVQLTGAWRLWTEHGGGEAQIQDAPLEPFTTTNPDHVFEIHPLTKVGDREIPSSLRPIEGYEAKDAQDAFLRYENLKCRLTPKAKTVTISTTMGGFNYVEFILEANRDPFAVPDGFMVMAQVLDLKEELIVRNRRMVFLKDTQPALTAGALRAGQRLHVLGIPRIDLALVSWRVRNASQRPEVLTWSLPYEIVIVGVYTD
jgi:hypothetical protein